MKKKSLLKDEAGFTLIEIIAVLVIMGILAAVAVPKFFDLQTKAREKAIYTAVSELKVRVNQHFANELLDGVVSTSVTYGSTDVGYDLGNDYAITAWNDNTATITFNVSYYPDPADQTKNPMTKPGTVAKPQTQT